jgi:hypothetical protein
MGGGNPRRRTGAEPRLQSGAGMSSKKRHPAVKGVQANFSGKVPDHTNKGSRP